MKSIAVMKFTLERGVLALLCSVAFGQVATRAEDSGAKSGTTAMKSRTFPGPSRS
jgi:hypothetical protein